MWIFRLRKFLKSVGKDGLILIWAIRHPATPKTIKLAAIAVLAYAISPLDFIPDIPGFGWIDDAAVLMVAIPFLLKRLPPQVRAQGQDAIERMLDKMAGRPSAG